MTWSRNFPTFTQYSHCSIYHSIRKWRQCWKGGCRLISVSFMEIQCAKKNNSLSQTIHPKTQVQGAWGICRNNLFMLNLEFLGWVKVSSITFLGSGQHLRADRDEYVLYKYNRWQSVCIRPHIDIHWVVLFVNEVKRSLLNSDFLTK